MEFFEEANARLTASDIQNLKLDCLDKLCSEIDKVISVDSVNSATIFCAWGEFIVERSLINGGVRFALPKCPNALAWTITTGLEPRRDHVVIHCVINRKAHSQDFIDSIELFVNAWKMGLENNFPY